MLLSLAILSSRSEQDRPEADLATHFRAATGPDWDAAEEEDPYADDFDPYEEE